MKKLVLFLAAVLMTAIGANVFAQSTGINPMIDSTHTYEVSDVGDTYTWTLEANATGGGTNLFGTGVSDVAEITGGSGTNSIDVLWKNPDIGTIYYLHVSVEESGACTNRKVLAIQPANNFQIYVYNVNADGSLKTGTDSLNYSVCAPSIPNTITWNGSGDVDDITEAQNFDYDYGTIIFYYKVEALGINFETTTWSPAMTIAQTAGDNATVTIDTIVGGTTPSGTWENVSSWETGTEFQPTVSTGSDHNVLWVRVTVENGFDTPSTANENTSDNSYSYSLSLGSGGNSVDGEGNTTTNTMGSAPVQTQLARPDTGGITTD